MIKKIKNQWYRQFLDDQVIEPITHQEIFKALDNVQGRWRVQGRSLLICLYITGARPNEILRLRAKDITKEKQYVRLLLRGSKGGTARFINLPVRSKLVKELYDYATRMPPDMYLFFKYRSRYKRTYRTKAKNQPQKTIIRQEITAKVRYWVRKWTEDIRPGSLVPYFFRHNRFSEMAMLGASQQDIKLFKGAKSLESVEPYIHYSTREMKRISRFVKIP